MRKIVLFIAMSLDGCIADPNGGIGWPLPVNQSVEKGARERYLDLRRR